MRAPPQGLPSSIPSAAIGVFLLVFLSPFPVMILFVFMSNGMLTLRVSIALAMLFGTGCAFGRITRRRPWVLGIPRVIPGAMLVGIALALGG